MSNGFIPVAIAHDLTCKPGEEWVFHELAKHVHGSLESPIDARDKELLDKDMEELRGAKEQLQDDFNSYGCIMAVAFVAIIVGVVIWAIW